MVRKNGKLTDPSYEILRSPISYVAQYIPPVPLNLVTRYTVSSNSPPETEPAYNPCSPPLRQTNSKKGEIIGYDINYYPNPASKSLHVTNLTVKGELAIINLIGSTILTQTIESNEMELDVSGLISGIYFISINGKVEKKFVKL